MIFQTAPDHYLKVNNPCTCNIYFLYLLNAILDYHGKEFIIAAAPRCDPISKFTSYFIAQLAYKLTYLGYGINSCEVRRFIF